jgi:hypothetical protein
VLCFVLLFGSIAYYILVFINELWPHCFARYCGRYFLRYQNEGLSQEDLDRMKEQELRLDANPLFAATGPIGDKSKSLLKEIENSKSALLMAKRQNDELKRLKTEFEEKTTVANPLVRYILRLCSELTPFSTDDAGVRQGLLVLASSTIRCHRISQRVCLRV